MHHLLQGGFEIDSVIELENELKDYENQYQIIAEEHQTNQDMHTVQHIALEEMKNKANFSGLLTKLKQDVKIKKEEIRVKTREFHEEEKIMKIDHQKMVTHEERYRKLKQLLRYHKS